MTGFGVVLLVGLAAAAAMAAQISGERAVVVRDGGYFPVLDKTRSGELLAVVRGGAPHIGIEGRLDLVRSKDGGRTWSPPAVIVDSPRDDRNPAFGVSSKGTPVLLYAVADAYKDGKFVVETAKYDVFSTRSTDGGKTWSPPRKVNISPYEWASPFGKIISLPDGTLLAPVYSGYYPMAGEKPPERQGEFAGLMLSQDDGQTWGGISLITRHFNETALVRLADGTLLAALRSAEGGLTAVTRSTDEGRTLLRGLRSPASQGEVAWSPLQEVTLKNQHPADLILLQSGAVLMVYGCRIEPMGARARLSRDGGRTWGPEAILWDDAINFDCGYPSSVQLADGTIVTVYYTVGSSRNPEVGVHAAAVRYREEVLAVGG